MNFGKIDRVEYGKNTLFEVVFQARFPELYIIGKENPVEFQELIRKNGYPESRKSRPSMPSDLPEEVRKIVVKDSSYNFLSEEKDWQVTLSANSIALTCLNHYSSYMDFRSRLEKVLDAFSKVYAPSYYTRVGLRYRNIINKVVLGDTDIKIEDCIPKHIAPELMGEVKENVSTFDKFILFDDGDIKANVATALVVISGKFGKHEINEEKSYIVDIDGFSENKIYEVEDALARSDSFNENIRNIFRWSITDELHQAMEPKSA